MAVKKKLGTVLVFKDGVSREQAALRVAALTDILEIPEHGIDVGPRAGLKKAKRTPEQAASSMIYEFDPRYGHPVWYIP